MIDFGLMSREELYAHGDFLAELAKERPDIIHRILFGLRNGMVKRDIFIGYGMGEVLWVLWRHWYYAVPGEGEPGIPFSDLRKWDSDPLSNPGDKTVPETDSKSVVA